MPSGVGGTGALPRMKMAKSPVGKQKGNGTCGEARRKEEGRRKEMWLCDNVVIWSSQITSAFYIATKW